MSNNTETQTHPKTNFEKTMLRTELEAFANEAWKSYLDKKIPPENFKNCKASFLTLNKENSDGYQCFSDEELQQIWLDAETYQKNIKAKEKNGNDSDDILKKKISGAKDALRQLEINLFKDTASGNIYIQREGKTSRLSDDHVLQLRAEIAGKFKFNHGKNLSEAEFSSVMMRDAVESMALDNQKNVMEEYIKSIYEEMGPSGDLYHERCLIDCFGVEDNNYNRVVGRYIYLGAIERMLNPGCKMDYIPILKGAGGIGKSIFVGNLLPSDFELRSEFINNNFNFHEQYRSLVMSISGKMFVENNELMGMKKAELEKLKSFITSSTDTYDKKFDKYTSVSPRTAMIIGTTDAQFPFIDDEWDHRRFVIVEIGSNKEDCQYETITDNQRIKQCISDAYHEYLNGGRAYDKMKLIREKQVMINQKNAYHDDITFERMEEFSSQFEPGKSMKISEIKEKLFDKHPKLSEMSSKLYASYLKKCGWKKEHKADGNYWVKPQSIPDRFSEKLL